MNVSRRSVLGGGLAGLVGVVMAGEEGERERLRWRLVPEGWGVAAEADVKAVLDVMMGQLPRGIVNREVVDRQGFKAKLEGFAKRFG